MYDVLYIQGTSLPISTSTARLWRHHFDASSKSRKKFSGSLFTLHFSPSGCFNQLSRGAIASVQTLTRSGEGELRGRDQNACWPCLFYCVMKSQAERMQG